MTISVWALESPSVGSIKGSIVYFATGFPALSNRLRLLASSPFTLARAMMRPYRPYHRSRREPAPVQRRRPSPRTTEMIPCTTRLLCSYTTHSVHSHLSTPHRTREGVQQPNLTVSSKHIFKLITLTLFFVPAEHALSPLDDNPRERGCDADARRRRDAALQRERQK